MMTRFAILLAAVLGLAGCGEEPAKDWYVSFQDIPAADQETFTRALNLFAARCPDLFEKYWGDVVEAKAEIMDNLPDGGVIELPYYKRYGWRKNILLKVELRIELQRVPRKYRANGHTLFYYLGGGRMPGIMAGKIQSQMVCGFAPDGNNDLHVPGPEFSILDELT